MKKFLLDTNILMSTENYEKLFNDYKDCELVIGANVIEELDNIKSREGYAGYQARRAIKAIRIHYDKFVFLQSKDNHLKEDKVDNQIIAAASLIGATVLTNDVNVQVKAKAFFDTEVDFYNQQKKTIKSGYVELIATDEELQSGIFDRVGDVPVGTYLIIRSEDGTEEYSFKQTTAGLMPTLDKEIKSLLLDPISPKDIYQSCAFDSLQTDNFTIITGKAGSGKTLLSLSYAMREVHSGRKDKLVIFVNPIKTRGSEELGYYPGDRIEKLMSNSIGAILTSKLGGAEGVLQLIDEGLLELHPISDIRGYEVGPKNIMYITEAQNLNIELIKLAIQRCSEGAKIILEGDPTTQVDHYSFEGEGNGLVRTIEVFEGFEGFSHVNLPIIYRSKIADRAEML